MSKRATPRAIRLLASVRDAEEAARAAVGGADIIDCKDPAAGALGALGADVVRRVRAVVPAEIPVSATIGDLASEPGPVVRAVGEMAAAGADLVKVGFFGVGEARATIAALGALDLGASRLVGVLIADRTPELALVAEMGRAGFRAVMLDTADKASPALPELVNDVFLSAFVERGRRAGLMVGLAGALRLRHIPPLLALAPDVLGFRGALCHNEDRQAELDDRSLARVRAAIPRAGQGAWAGWPDEERAR
jgi:uncharacterized protein (UPF0264 family)